MEQLFDLEGVDLANELSNNYAVTFDEAYAFYVITQKDAIKTTVLAMDIAKTRNFKQVVLDYYNN